MLKLTDAITDMMLSLIATCHVQQLIDVMCGTPGMESPIVTENHQLPFVSFIHNMAELILHHSFQQVTYPTVHLHF